MAGKICTNPRTGKTKVRYARKQQAIGAAAVSSQRTGRAIEIYRCPFCGDFHLTSREQEAKIAVPPSAAKLRRKLAAYAAEFAAAELRIRKADEELARQKAKAEEIRRQAEANHSEELEAIRIMTARLHWVV